jgi:hypothetical protein
VLRFSYTNRVSESYYLEDTKGKVKMKTKIISCQLVLVKENGSELCSLETCGAYQLWKDPGLVPTFKHATYFPPPSQLTEITVMHRRRYNGNPE